MNQVRQIDFITTAVIIVVIVIVLIILSKMNIIVIVIEIIIVIVLMMNHRENSFLSMNAISYVYIVCSLLYLFCTVVLIVEKMIQSLES